MLLPILFAINPLLFRSFWFHVQNDNAASTQGSRCKTLEKPDTEILPNQPMSESSKVHLCFSIEMPQPSKHVSCLVSQLIIVHLFPRLVFQIKFLLVTCLSGMLPIVKR